MIKNKIRQFLEKGQIQGFLGFKEKHGHPLPHLFTKENINELEDLVESETSYPLTRILLRISLKYPNDKFGIMVTPTAQKAIIELCKQNQIEKEKFLTILIKQKEPTIMPSVLDKITKLSLDERLKFWQYNFTKCIKCYGCRNICPICFCPSCCLEEDILVRHGEVPPEFPVFHLSKAMCMAARCIDCGMCEEACPANIPLRSIYKKINDKIKEFFDYEPGLNLKDRNPLSFLGDEESLKNLKLGLKKII
jgi:ferredoxin